MPKRIRAHELESESFNKFEYYVPSKWVFRRKDNPDYGIDAELEIFDSDGHTTGYLINVQLKSTDATDIKDCLKAKFKVDTLKYYSTLQYPVLIAKYLKHFNQIIYCWAHSKRKNQIKEGQKSTTVHFSEHNILDKKTFQQLESDTKNYIKFHNQRLTPPFKLYLIVKDAEISKSEIALSFKRYGLQNEVCIKICDKADNDAIGKISVTTKDTLISIGGDSATFIFSNSDNDYLGTDKFIADANMALAFLLQGRGNALLATKLISPIYKKSSFFDKSDFIIGLLKCFYDANEMDLVLEASRWSIEEKNHIKDVEMFSFLLYKNYNRSMPAERRLVENILILLKQYYSHKEDKENLGTSYYNLGNFYYSLSEYRKALYNYNHARKYQPSYNTRNYFWCEIGTILFNAGKKRFASIAYKKSLDLKDEDDVRAKYADALIHIGEYTKGIKELKKYCAEENQKKDHYWCLKLMVLQELMLQYKIKDGKRKIKDAEAIAYKHEPQDKEITIKAIALDPLNHFAWFSLGIFYNQKQRIEDSLWAFLWSAFCSEFCVDAWANAFVSTLVLPKSTKANFLSYTVLEAAFRINHDKFISTVFQNIDDNPFTDKRNKEHLKSLILEMVNDIKTGNDFKVRLVDNHNVIEILKS